jgi:hypothetical protein
VSFITPTNFQEKILRIYLKDTKNMNKFKNAQGALYNFCKEKMGVNPSKMRESVFNDDESY